jgi:hypothetical protein
VLFASNGKICQSAARGAPLSCNLTNRSNSACGMRSRILHALLLAPAWFGVTR